MSEQVFMLFVSTFEAIKKREFDSDTQLMLSFINYILYNVHAYRTITVFDSPKGFTIKQVKI